MYLSNEVQSYFGKMVKLKAKRYGKEVVELVGLIYPLLSDGKINAVRFGFLTQWGVHERVYLEEIQHIELYLIGAESQALIDQVYQSILEKLELERKEFELAEQLDQVEQSRYQLEEEMEAQVEVLTTSFGFLTLHEVAEEFLKVLVSEGGAFKSFQSKGTYQGYDVEFVIDEELDEIRIYFDYEQAVEDVTKVFPHLNGKEFVGKTIFGHWKDKEDCLLLIKHFFPAFRPLKIGEGAKADSNQAYVVYRCFDCLGGKQPGQWLYQERVFYQIQYVAYTRDTLQPQKEAFRNFLIQ